MKAIIEKECVVDRIVEPIMTDKGAIHYHNVGIEKKTLTVFVFSIPIYRKTNILNESQTPND